MRRFRLVFILLSVALILTIAFAAHSVWLQWASGFLVRCEEPEQADAIFVFAGDWTCARVLKAAELHRNGFAPRVLISSPMDLYENREGDLAVGCAGNHGYGPDGMKQMQMEARSTVEESAIAAREFKRMGLRQVLAVTSDFHTRRAGKLLRAATGGEVRVRMICAPYKYFDRQRWWKTREGRKTVVMEWSKTIATAFGL